MNLFPCPIECRYYLISCAHITHGVIFLIGHLVPCSSLLFVCLLFSLFRAFQSGFEVEPVMCQTVNTVFDKNYCPWVSCGEWCLTKTSGFCPQMYATSRRNGTDIQLENCSMHSSVSCPEVDAELLKTKRNCNNGTECSDLNGLFECWLGMIDAIQINIKIKY